MNSKFWQTITKLLTGVILMSFINIHAQNPWNSILDKVPSIKVIDKKAEALGAVENGKDPVFEITVKDVGLYFGYLTPPIVEAFIMTDKALKKLYPEGLPERGGIRVASQTETDFMLTASYITGARPYYFVKGFANSDLVVDASIKNEDGYALYFQRKDNGKTVGAFLNNNLVHDNEQEFMKDAMATIKIVNGMPLEGMSTETAKERLFNLLKISVDDDRGAITVKEIDNYVFPEVK